VFEEGVTLQGTYTYSVNLLSVKLKENLMVCGFFQVLHANTLAQSGSITRIYNTDINCYTTNIYFSDPSLDPRVKSLFLAAAFLLEYMFFQSKLGL
jgi:hypothetical protein